MTIIIKYLCYENNFHHGFDSIKKDNSYLGLKLLFLMWLNPVTKIIYTFNVEPQKHNDDGLIGTMKIIMVNQNNTMTTFWSKQQKYIPVILFIWYDTCNNVDVDSQWY